MPYRQDLTTGEWIEVDAQGNPLSPGGRIATLPQSPEKQAEQARQAERDAAADADRAADNARADRALALQEENAALTREGTTKQRAEWNANLNNIGLLEQTLADLRKQYNDHFKGKGLFQSSAEAWAPTYFAPQYGVFDTTAQSMLADMAKAKGLSAQQFNTPAEQRMFFEPLIPKRGDTDEQIEKKLDNLQRMIATGRATTEQNLGITQQRADNEVPQANGAATRNDGPSAPGPLPPANMPGGNDPTPPPNAPPLGTVWDADITPGESAVDTGVLGFGNGTREVDNPKLRATVASLVNSGAGFATVNAALKAAGQQPISLQEWGAVQQWRQKNPGVPYPASSVHASDTVPLSAAERVRGSDLAAFTANMANSATAGIPTYLAGEEGERALASMRAAHPDSSVGGTVVGGLTGALGAEAALAARAPLALARYAPRMADALYGATSGFTGAEDGNRLAGALTGAVVAPIAGRVGEGVVNGVGSVARGVVDPAVQRLREAGVPLTVGEIVGNGGVVGRSVKKIEDALTSFPGVGSMIEARRREGWRGLNDAAFDIGAQTTGGQVQDTGAAGVAQLRGLVGNTYDRALDNVRLDVAGDPVLPVALHNAQMDALTIPGEVGQDAADALAYRFGTGTDVDGTMSGRDFQEAYRGLARDGRGARDAYVDEFRGAMREGQDVLGEALERQNPGAFETFIDANTANRRANVLADAVNAAKNQPDELFSPAQLNAADANSATRLTGRLNSASGNRPFYELATDAQQVMGNRLPNSGTADRAWTGLLLGGGLGAGGGYAAGDTGTGTGVGLGTSAALMLGGTRRGQALMRELLLNRPEVLRSAGEALQRRAQLGGGFGAGVITPLLVGP